MPLKDRPRTNRKPTIHGAPCSIGEVYRANLTDPDELAELQQILYRDGLNAAQVLTELTVHGGYDVARTAINKHRGKNCRCFTIDRDFCPDCAQHLDAHDACDKTA